MREVAIAGREGESRMGGLATGRTRSPVRGAEGKEDCRAGKVAILGVAIERATRKTRVYGLTCDREISLQDISAPSN